MARVFFTTNLRRHVDLPEAEAAGDTVRAVLGAVFAKEPRIGGYVLDDQGCLRKHMAIIVDGHALRDRVALSDAVTAKSEIHVFQALSGG